MSNTICHYTRFFRFLESNCNGCNVGDPKMVELELLHLFAENGLVAKDSPMPGEDWPSRQFRWEVPPAAGYNTYGGGGAAPRNTPRNSLLDQGAAALWRGDLAAGLRRFLARAQLRTPILSRLLARLPRDQALADGGVFGRVDYVFVPGGQYAGDLLFGLLDARGIHGVGRKDASDRTALFPLQRLQLLEDADGAVGIVAGGVEILHAQLIGLRFILAREVQKRRGDADASALADDRAANAAPQNDCHGDARQVDDLGFGGLFGHVARRHVRDLVGHRRRQLVLAFQGFPFALKIFHGVVLIDVVSLEEAVNLVAGFKAKQAPQIWLIEMTQPVFFRQQGLQGAAGEIVIDR